MKDILSGLRTGRFVFVFLYIFVVYHIQFVSLQQTKRSVPQNQRTLIKSNSCIALQSIDSEVNSVLSECTIL